MLVVALCLFATNGFFSENKVEAGVIHLTQTGLSFKLKADFKVMSFIPTQ
jgi:hypothetical protein